MLVFAHNAEEIVLQFVSRDVGKQSVSENGVQIHAEGAFVLLKGGREIRFLGKQNEKWMFEVDEMKNKV